MKLYQLLLIATLFINVLNAQEMQLPFFDDFSNDYENWTTYSITGDDQWHLSGDDGIDGSKCARFYLTSNPPQANDDWLVSKVINTEEVSNLVITFKYLYQVDGPSPKFYYSTTFNGDPTNTDWTQIDKSFWNEAGGWNDARIDIETPGENFVFALRYQVSENDPYYYFLMDNFKIESYTPVTYTFSDSTKYFSFYSTLENGQDYWNQISYDIDNWYTELCSYWDRPGITPIFNPEQKTKIYLINNEDFQNQAESELPTWKCGYIQNSSTVFTKLPEGENSLYDNSYSTLVKNTLGQYILNKHFQGNIDDYFKEGFGLFYSGYQPKRDSILKALTVFGNSPSLDVLKNITNLSTSYLKDFITSYIEAQVLSVNGIQKFGQNDCIDQWQSHLEYYYNKPENERIKLSKQTERFNIYAADSDLPYLDAIANKLEESISFYETLFDFPVKHRFHCVVYPTLQARGDCLIISGGNGGGAWSGDNLEFISKNEGLDYNNYYGLLIPHELFHVFHFNMVTDLNTIPALYTEGLAMYIPLSQNENYLNGRENDQHKITDAFHHYTNNYNIEPRFEQFLEWEPDENYNGYYNDPYYFGQLFYKYFFENIGDFSDLRTFFVNDLDYTKIGKNYDDIDHGYVTFLKDYARLIPSKQLARIPFNESFNNFTNGWGRPSYYNNDNWQIDARGNEGTSCAGFYINNDKNIPIESWLISPPLDTKNMKEVNFSFDFARSGDGIEIELLYTTKFKEFTDSTTWSLIKSIKLMPNSAWHNTGEITIQNPPDTLYIAIRKKSSEPQQFRLYLDNFKVDGLKTASDFFEISNNFKVYPNPITSKSFISFQTKTNGNVNLSIFDIQGRKICTLLDEKLNAGKHTISVSNSLPGSGIYICKLQSTDGVSTKKIIVNTK